MADELENGAGRGPGGPGAAAIPGEETRERVRLVRGGGILLDTGGFRIVGVRGLRRSPWVPYEAITHLVAGGRALLVGTSEGLTIVRAGDFPDPETGPEEAREALLARVAERPDGGTVLRRIEALDARARAAAWSWSVWGVVVLCLLGTVAQLRDPLILEFFASFSPALFERGELWRAVTAHFLHGLPTLPVHLALNVAGLLVLGPLVERPLGHVRTVVVFALGGVGTVFGTILYGHDPVVGASGLVSALAGAMLALELHFPQVLACQWRLPRRLFIGALLFQFLVVDQLFSNVLAGGAHLGGFVGGYVAGFGLGRPELEGDDSRIGLRVVAVGVVSVLVASVVMALPLVMRESTALERHALRLLNAPAKRVEHDNAVAWFIATEGEPSPSGLDLAVALADRAVRATGRRNPNVLDTLAEALFQAGDRFGALVTIEEAILLAPGEPYFVEQRRRFIGERDADDRPAPPGSGPADGEDPDAMPPSYDPDAPAITL